jgi:hypothetical protein
LLIVLIGFGFALVFPMLRPNHFEHNWVVVVSLGLIALCALLWNLSPSRPLSTWLGLPVALAGMCLGGSIVVSGWTAYSPSEVERERQEYERAAERRDAEKRSAEEAEAAHRAGTIPREEYEEALLSARRQQEGFEKQLEEYQERATFMRHALYDLGMGSLLAVLSLLFLGLLLVRRRFTGASDLLHGTVKHP